MVDARPAVALAACLMAGAACAQSRITADDFLDRALGNTLYFYLLGSGQLVGVEQFLRRDLSVWRPRGQDCVYGQISIEDGLLCFLYDGETPDEKSCWFTFERGDQLIVRGIEVFDAEVQIVEQISQEPLSCPNPPTS